MVPLYCKIRSGLSVLLSGVLLRVVGRVVLSSLVSDVRNLLIVSAMMGS